MQTSTRPVVCLRDPRDEDALVHVAHPPEAEIVRMYGALLEDTPPRTLERSQAWVEWLRGHPFGRIIEADGVAVGEIRFHSLSQEDRKARLALGMFSTQALGKGIGRRAITLALDHAFGPMGLHRVDLRVLAYNLRGIRCYQACGFVHEGTEREAACVGGVWYDDWIMGILAHEHAALRHNHHHP